MLLWISVISFEVRHAPNCYVSPFGHIYVNTLKVQANIWLRLVYLEIARAEKFSLLRIKIISFFFSESCIPNRNSLTEKNIAVQSVCCIYLIKMLAWNWSVTKKPFHFCVCLYVFFTLSGNLLGILYEKIVLPCAFLKHNSASEMMWNRLEKLKAGKLRMLRNVS